MKENVQLENEEHNIRTPSERVRAEEREIERLLVED